MASNLWRVERYGNGRRIPYKSFTDKLGREFPVYRARLDHQAGAGYPNRRRANSLTMEKLIEARRLMMGSAA